ncbi:diguanylate cyclase [Paenibacillus hodogayensis]|uniref:Diguanylate cyclase n=1 Tax=Paenibacillus hodogayensis TaxID=279208 RepID=A0ABV5W0M8_9BACL
MDPRLNEAPCGYVSITHEGLIMDVNQTFLDKMGYARSDLVNQHVEAMMSTANKLIFHSYFYPFINLNGQVEELFIGLKNSSGQSIPYLLNGRRFDHEGVEVIDCILMQMGKRIDYEQELRSAKKQTEEAYREKEQAFAKLEHIHKEIEKKQAELIEMNALLVELSTTDKLTGLKNRRFFQEKLTELIDGYSRTRQPFSLLIVDIDHFKRINDTFGHQTGDDVLEKLASILKAHSRQDDIAARYGGEEFVIILPNTDGPESRRIAEHLRTIIADTAWQTGTVTASVGAATFTPEDSAATLLEKADRALYVSKETGRNRVTHAMDLPQG